MNQQPNLGGYTKHKIQSQLSIKNTDKITFNYLNWRNYEERRSTIEKLPI